jgi:PPOX class probable F420-dependent enzyme
MFPDSHLDLLDQPGVGILSTLGPDGYPQTTAIWFIRDGDNIVTSVTTDRQKFKNAVRHPKVTFFVVDPTNQFRTIEIRGDLTSEPDPSLDTLRRVVAPHGLDLETFRGPKENRVTITVTPHHIVANG